MKIFLKTNWDYPPNYEKESSGGYFIGRKKEKDKLVDELVRKSSGSILISGSRGVGKTALVYEALKNAISIDKSLIPIIINASQLELYLKEEDVPKAILNNLIRRFYGFFQSRGKKDNKDLEDLIIKVGELYKKAVAKEVNITEKISNKDISRKNEENKKENIISIAINKYFIFWLLAVFALMLPDIAGYRYINTFLGIIFFILPHINFNFSETINDIKEKFYSNEKVISAEEFYKHDNSLSNIEFEFNELLKSFKNKGFKIVFVIDELDKISTTENSEEIIFQIIKTYKNLFTLSSALFIFITSEDAYKTIINEKGKRGQYYTLFNNRIFLTRPNFEDIEKFIEEIINKVEVKAGEVVTENFVNKLKDEDLKLFKNFKNYLCYISVSDYFELYLIIRDFILYYENNLPVIEIDEFSFDLEKRLKSKLQKVIGQIYNLNFFPEQSKWDKNEVILSEIYEFLNENYYKKFNIVGRGDVIIYYLIPYLQRLKIIQETESDDESGQDERIWYQWTNNIPGESDMEDIKKLPGILFNEEKEYIEITKKYIQQFNDIDDLVDIVLGKIEPTKYDFDTGIAQGRDGEKYTGINAYNVYNNQIIHIEGLQKDCPENININKLAELTEELNSVMEKLKLASLKLLNEIIKKILFNKSYKHAERQLQSDPTLFGSVGDLREQIIKRNLSHYVILNEPTNSKQLLLTFNLPPEILIASNLIELENKKSYKLINIQTDDEIDYKGKDKVIVDKIKLVPKRKGGKKKKRIIVKEEIEIKSFINIKLEDDYQIFIDPIKNIVDWFVI